MTYDIYLNKVFEKKQTQASSPYSNILSGENSKLQTSEYAGYASFCEEE
jgi:hypothetical protein